MSWMDKLDDERREKVEYELARQQRALKGMLAGKTPKRTARRIIQRSKERVRMIAGQAMMEV